jgi:hypothetical protein
LAPSPRFPWFALSPSAGQAAGQVRGHHQQDCPDHVLAEAGIQFGIGIHHFVVYEYVDAMPNRVAPRVASMRPRSRTPLGAAIALGIREMMLAGVF